MSDATTVGMELSRFKAFSSADREPIVAHGDASLAGWPAEVSKFEGQGKPLDAQKAMKWRCSLLRLLTYLSKIATVKSAKRRFLITMTQVGLDVAQIVITIYAKNVESNAEELIFCHRKSSQVCLYLRKP